MRAVLKKASYGTRRVFKGAKQPTPQTVNSLLCTGHIFRGAKQPTPQTVDSLLCTGHIFRGAKQPTPIRAPLIIQ